MRARGRPNAGRPAAGTAPAAADPWTAAVVAASLVYLGMVAWVIARRIGYPYELEFVEGAVLEQVARLRQGLPMYVAPSLAYVPLNYTPLYFWLAALAGATLTAARAVSVAATVAALAGLWVIVRHETRRAAPAWLALGLFAALFRRGGAWLDVARADTLQLALLLWGVAVVRLDRSRWRMPLVAATLFAAAFLAKQSALAAVAPLVVALFVLDRRRGLVLAATTAALVGTAIVTLDATSGGWFRYYAFTVPSFHAPDPRLLWVFPLRDVAIPLWPLLVLIVAAAPRTRRGVRAAAFSVAVAAGFMGTAWALRSYAGGYDNVLMPAHAALAWLAALAFARATAAPTGARLAWRRHAAAALIAVQLALLWWNPLRQVPAPGDRLTGDDFVAGLRDLGPRVLVATHPYLAARAGLPTHAHVMPLMDVVRDGHGPRERALRAALADSLRAHVWDPLILDNDDWLADDAVAAGYRSVAEVFPSRRAFWPVTGMLTRPQYVMRPAADSAGVARP